MIDTVQDAEGELDELDANSTGDQPELDADEDDDGLPYPWVRLVDEDGPYYYNEACAKTEKLALGHSKHLMQVKTFRFRPKLEYSERKRDLGVLGALSW
ncbi:unnamed protein product [Effrenium voratum]|nr:unnamed protein product [Effrenium voratum]